MPNFYDPVEILWEALLSRQPDQIQAAFIILDSGSQRQVLQHLRDMKTDEGWQPEQRFSAQAALDLLAGE
jgi:hypothetical protein